MEINIKPYLSRMYRDGCRGQSIYFKWIEYGVGDDGKKYKRVKTNSFGSFGEWFLMK